MSIIINTPILASAFRFAMPDRLREQVLSDHSKLFDCEIILPILSRLPNSESDNNNSRNIPLPQTDYFTLKGLPNLPGVLCDSSRPVLYTASCLPSIDESSQHLWKALHELRLLTSDYAGEFGSSCRPVQQCPLTTSSPSSRGALQLIRSIFNWEELSLPLHTSGTFYGVVLSLIHI